VVRAYGGRVEIVEIPDQDGSFQKRRIAVARRLAQEIPRCVNLDQYSNPAAIDAHVNTTGPEIFAQRSGQIDVLIGCASTGSHLSGAAKYLKERDPNIKVIGVEPVGSVVFGGAYAPFLQNGSGLSFRPANILHRYIDECVKVSDEDAFSMCRRMARTEGLLLGGSSGSVLHVAEHMVNRATRGCNVVVILPDGGMKYLETIYDDQWLRKHDLHAVLGETRPVVRQVHFEPALAEQT
jgi:cysteine synthase